MPPQDPTKILIVDDDDGVLTAISLLLKSEGFASQTANSPSQALKQLENNTYQLALIDLNFSLDTTSGEEGIRLIQAIRKIDELIPIVVMTGWGSIEVAVQTLQKGANDFIQKPWDNDRLIAILNNQIQLANFELQSRKLTEQNQLLRDEIHSRQKLVAISESMKHTLSILEQVSATDASILLTGENGTGKSMYARYLHEKSDRRDQPFISVNMGAVPESLFESEMFGHVKGAFTDAKDSRIGRFELANTGVLFLDEIANIPLPHQAKLLRALEEREFERVGSSKTQSVDIRLITATNCDLDKAVKEQDFRQDLLYRINTIEIKIPPLRERKEDIIPLANTFLEQVAQKYKKTKKTISEEAVNILINYHWPGNVRELNHVIERAHILSRSDNIRGQDLGIFTSESQAPARVLQEDLRSLEEIESDAIEARIQQFDNDSQKAADSLGISRSALYRKRNKSK